MINYKNLLFSGERLRILALVCIVLCCVVVYGHYLAAVLPVVQTGPAQTVVPPDARSQYNLAMDYIAGRGVTQDLNKALALFTQAAEGGYAEAQFMLGNFNYNGFANLVVQNYSKSYIWFSLAESSGYAKAAAFRYEVGANLSPAELLAAKKEIARLQALNDFGHHAQ